MSWWYFENLKEKSGLEASGSCQRFLEVINISLRGSQGRGLVYKVSRPHCTVLLQGVNTEGPRIWQEKHPFTNALPSAASWLPTPCSAAIQDNQNISLSPISAGTFLLPHHQMELVVIFKVWKLNCASGKEMNLKWEAGKAEKQKSKPNKTLPPSWCFLKKHNY